MALAEIFETVIAEAPTPLTDIPAYANQDYLAGRIQVLFGVDIHAELRECMKPDSKLNVNLDQAMSSFQQDDPVNGYQLIVISIENYEPDYADCYGITDDMDSTLDALTEYWTLFYPNLTQETEDTCFANYMANEWIISGYETQMVTSWYAGHYFNAGQYMGLIGDILNTGLETEAVIA